MNKYLNVAHWLLVIVAVLSLLAAGQTGLSLWQTSKVNAFISDPTSAENVPEHLKAQFSKAYNEAKQGKSQEAMERLTTVVATKDEDLEAAAYFNRGNIHLQDARALAADDTARVALIGLAKQDYRTALLLDSSLWDARYNLELALRMAPEESADKKPYVKRKDSETRVVKAVGFRVDLP
jgi:mxaK protein